VCYHNGRKFLYATAFKAIYGAMKSTLLFYQLFSGELTDWGFKKNDYDACTMNKMLNGSQLTIVWHVDDCKISHVDEKMVTDMLNKLDFRKGVLCHGDAMASARLFRNDNRLLRDREAKNLFFRLHRTNHK